MAGLYMKQLHNYSLWIQDLGDVAGDYMNCFSDSSKAPNRGKVNDLRDAGLGK